MQQDSKKSSIPAKPEQASEPSKKHLDKLVDEAAKESFPASDPPPAYTTKRTQERSGSSDNSKRP